MCRFDRSRRPALLPTRLARSRPLPRWQRPLRGQAIEGSGPRASGSQAHTQAHQVRTRRLQPTRTLLPAAPRFCFPQLPRPAHPPRRPGSRPRKEQWPHRVLRVAGDQIVLHRILPLPPPSTVGAQCSYRRLRRRSSPPRYVRTGTMSVSSSMIREQGRLDLEEQHFAGIRGLSRPNLRAEWDGNVLYSPSPMKGVAPPPRSQLLRSIEPGSPVPSTPFRLREVGRGQRGWSSCPRRMPSPPVFSTLFGTCTNVRSSKRSGS
jgi:hypothetical protein